MEVSYLKYTNVEDFRIIYTYEESSISFRWHINLFDCGDEGDVILEMCVEEKQTNMIALPDSPCPYFYLHIPIIQDLGIQIPFSFPCSK